VAQTATSRIVNAANSFLSTRDDKQRQSVLFAFDDEEQRKRWSNLPITIVARAGMNLGAMNSAQRSAAMALLSSALSQRGLEKVYQLEYVQTGVSWWSGPRGFLAATIVVMLARIAWLWRQRSISPTRNRRSRYERGANPDSAPGPGPALRAPETRSSEPPAPDLAPSSLCSRETRLTHSRL